MPSTLARIISVGMPEAEAFKRATLRPAEILGLDGEIGTLAPGACADLTILSNSPKPMLLANSENGGHHGPNLEPTLTVRGGEVVST
jgi:dihydroorotase